MKYPIDDAYFVVNGERISVGVCLGEEDDPKSHRITEVITNSEYEAGLKCFKYGRQRIDLCCSCTVVVFEDSVADRPIKKKWIDEMIKMGYDLSSLKYDIQE